MRRIYSAGFDLGSEASPRPSLEDVIAEIKEWVASPEGRPPELLAPRISHDFCGTGQSTEGARRLETLRVESTGREIWALRWIQPESETSQPRIQSEVVLRRAGEQLNYSIHIGYERVILHGKGIAPRRPRINRTLLERFGGACQAL